jgi:hypothetical protein
LTFSDDRDYPGQMPDAITLEALARAAKVLAGLLDKLRSESARGRRGHLALVKPMTTSPPSAYEPSRQPPA